MIVFLLFYFFIALPYNSAVFKFKDVAQSFKQNFVRSQARITSLVDTSMEDCMLECQRRRRCISITYSERFKLCTLNRERSATEFTISQGMLYSEKHTWNEALSAHCIITCGLKERCYKSRCIPSDCGSPPNVKNAFTQDDDEVGIYAKVKYQCNVGYQQSGVPHIGCQSNGEWSPPRITCTPVQCGPPAPMEKMEVSFEGDLPVYGSTADYVCNICSSLQTESTSDESVVQSTCERNGQWTAINATCNPDWTCKDEQDGFDITIILDATCSINSTEFEDQITFSQNLIKTLRQVSSCPRVGCYKHSDMLYKLFDPGTYLDSYNICKELQRIEQACIKGAYIRDMVNIIPLFTKGTFILVLSDSRPFLGDIIEVQKKAEMLNIYVIYIHMKSVDTISTHDHFNAWGIPGVLQLNTQLDRCLQLISHYLNVKDGGQGTE